MKNVLYICLSVFLLSACEDVINPDLDLAEPVLVIDAWLDAAPRPQKISVTRTQPYFDNQLPQQVTGAQVYVVRDDGSRIDFEETPNGYIYDSNLVYFVVDRSYTLFVETPDGESFISETTLNRAPAVDSVKFTYNEADAFFDEPYYTAEFLATDFQGEGDTYWIKAYKNNRFLNKPNEINLAFDAGFTRGAAVDGLVFLQPIQDAVNPFDEDPENEDEILSPYAVNDTLRVEIHSISQPAFFFLNEVLIQTDRQGGFGALFAQPLANVSTNIVNMNENSTAEVLGFFNVAQITSNREILTQELADEAKRIAEEGE